MVHNRTVIRRLCQLRNILYLVRDPAVKRRGFLTVGEEYELKEFVEKARIALNMASDLVKAAFGYPCSKAMQRVVPKGIPQAYGGFLHCSDCIKTAMAQLQQIEMKAQEYQNKSASKVKILGFTDL